MRQSAPKQAALAIASLLAAPAALAASDYFLEIRGIDGEANARAASSRVEVQSFSWGASQSKVTGSGAGAGKASMQDLSATRAVTPREPASGMASGKRQHAPATPAAPPAEAGPSFVVNAHDNPNTRALLAACASGRPIPVAVVTAEGQRYEVRELTVVSCDAVGAGGERKIVTRTGHVTLMK